MQQLYLRECTGGAAGHVVPGVIHDVCCGIGGVAVMVERVERQALGLSEQTGARVCFKKQISGCLLGMQEARF